MTSNSPTGLEASHLSPKGALLGSNSRGGSLLLNFDVKYRMFAHQRLGGFGVILVALIRVRMWPIPILCHVKGHNRCDMTGRKYNYIL